MYSTNLAKISLDEFKEILLKAQLLPTQKTILNNLADNIQKLKNKGLKSLQELHSFLKKKENYTSIAEDTGIDKEYLVILNRMVNSHIVKASPLAKLEIFTKEELEVLAEVNIKNTEHYYDNLATSEYRENISAKIHVPIDKLEYALHIIDLLRINGVGVEYAKIIYDMGIKSVSDYNNTSSEAILKSYKELNSKKTNTKATLGISDIDYCRRFCENLDCDIK